MNQGNRLFKSVDDISEHFLRLKASRKPVAARHRTWSRRPVSRTARSRVLSVTQGLCHICGGDLDGDWVADHLLAYARKASAIYLPAHPLCNRLRWHYGPEEFQWIIKLGVWLRTRIEKRDQRVDHVAEAFRRHELRRAAKSPGGTP